MTSTWSCQTTRLVFFGGTWGLLMLELWSGLLKVTCLMVLLSLAFGTALSSKTTTASSSLSCSRFSDDLWSSISIFHNAFSLFFSAFNWSKKSWKNRKNVRIMNFEKKSYYSRWQCRNSRKGWVATKSLWRCTTRVAGTNDGKSMMHLPQS